MPAFTVKNIPEDLYQQLKQAATTHHRSINGEVIACLESALKPQPISAEQHLLTARNLRSHITADKLPAEEIAQAKNEGRP